MHSSVAIRIVTTLCNVVSHYLVPELLLSPTWDPLHREAGTAQSLFLPGTWQPLIDGLAYSGYFVSVDSYTKWPVVSGMFHLACCRGPSVLQQLSVLHSALWLGSSPGYGRPTVCVSSSADVYLNGFYPVAIVTRAAMDKLLFERLLSVLWGICPGSGIAG